MDHFSAMRAFVATVRRRSLAGAAEELGLSRPLVSRQLQALENRLDTRLMHRTTRTITLTQAGERYFDLCDRMLAQMAALEAEIVRDAQDEAGEVSVLVPVWLTQQVSEVAIAFAQEYPEIQPRLVVGNTASTAYDFLDRGCDVAFFPRRPPDSRIIARRLCDIAFRVCASPSYLAQHAAPETPEDIVSHAGLCHADHPLWDFRRDDHCLPVGMKPVFRADTHLVLHQAALRGLGLAILPDTIVAADLEAGRLIALMPDWSVQSGTLYIATAPGGGTPTRVKRFTDFAVSRFRA